MKFKYTDCRFLQTVMATKTVVPEEAVITERDEFVSSVSNIFYEGYRNAGVELAAIRYMLQTALATPKKAHRLPTT